MPEETTKVKVELVADEAAKKLTEDLKKELGDTHKATEKAGEAMAEAGKKGTSSFRDFFKASVLAQKAQESLGGAAAALAGPYGVALESVDLLKEALSGAYEMAEKFAESALEAAEGVREETQAMAGQFSIFDAGKHNFEDIQRYAAGVHEELENMGIAAGITGKQMSEMYDMLIERGGLSSEKAKGIANDMAIVGKISRHGAQGLAEGFNMMEMGMVRARNPIVQLISATGVLKGNAQAVAMQLQHMTPAKQIELGERAIAMQADRMRKGGALSHLENLGTLKTSFEGIREKMLAAVGEPMMDRLIPQLVKIKDWLVTNADQIEAFANRVGDKFGEMIDWFSDAFGGIYDAISENWDDIVSTTKDLISPLSSLWDYIHEHQSAIGRFFKDVTTDVVGAYKWIDKAMHDVSEELMNVIKAIPIVGKKVAALQAEDIAQHARVTARGVGGESDHAVDEQIEKYRKVAQEAGKSSKEIEETVANIRSWHQVAQTQGKEAVDELRGGHNQAFADYINRAIRMQNDGALDFAIKVLNNSDLGKKALVEGGMQIEGGFDHFLSIVRDKSPELAKQLKEMANTIKKEGGIKGMGPSINFNNNTFNIHQDFKDDPDRIMMVFRQDILKSAVSRRQSRLGSAFGL